MTQPQLKTAQTDKKKQINNITTIIFTIIAAAIFVLFLPGFQKTSKVESTSSFTETVFSTEENILQIQKDLIQRRVTILEEQKKLSQEYETIQKMLQVLEAKRGDNE